MCVGGVYKYECVCGEVYTYILQPDNKQSHLYVYVQHILLFETINFQRQEEIIVRSFKIKILGRLARSGNSCLSQNINKAKSLSFDGQTHKDMSLKGHQRSKDQFVKREGKWQIARMISQMSTLQSVRPREGNRQSLSFSVISYTQISFRWGKLWT